MKDINKMRREAKEAEGIETRIHTMASDPRDNQTETPKITEKNRRRTEKTEKQQTRGEQGNKKTEILRKWEVNQVDVR